MNKIMPTPKTIVPVQLILVMREDLDEDDLESYLEREPIPMMPKSPEISSNSNKMNPNESIIAIGSDESLSNTIASLSKQFKSNVCLNFKTIHIQFYTGQSTADKRKRSPKLKVSPKSKAKLSPRMKISPQSKKPKTQEKVNSPKVVRSLRPRTKK